MAVTGAGGLRSISDDVRAVLAVLWRELTLAFLGIALAGAIFAWLLPSGPRWFLAGAWVVGMLWFLCFALGTMANITYRVRGVLGERFTAQLFCGRRQRREGWSMVNGLSFKGHGDVDHVLIGPGGVFVIETKWTSAPCDIVDGRLTGAWGRRDPLDQAWTGARLIRSMLRHEHRLDVEPVPVVALWGPGAPALEGQAEEVGGTWVISALDSSELPEFMRRDLLRPDVRAAVKQALSGFAARQREYRRRTDKATRQRRNRS